MWRYLLYVEENIPDGWREQSDWDRLCREMAQHDVEAISLSPIYSTENLRTQLQNAGIPARDCLFLAWREAEIRACLGLETEEPGTKLALAAYEYEAGSRENGREDLSGAPYLLLGLQEIDREFLLGIYKRKHGLPWEILRTRRCVLRELCMEDMDALFELYGKPGVTDYVEPLYERSREEEYQRAYIENMYGYYGYGMWLVTERGTGKVIGRAGLEHRQAVEEAVLEMGYIIAPEYQRRGYGCEVCRGILAWAEEHLEFPYVQCLVRPGNEASVALLHKLGFTEAEQTFQDGRQYRRFLHRLQRRSLF